MCQRKGIKNNEREIGRYVEIRSLLALERFIKTNWM